MAWSPRSPDLYPLDFFFWRQMNSLVYETSVNSAKDLVARIVVATDNINTTPGIFERSDWSRLHDGMASGVTRPPSGLILAVELFEITRVKFRPFNIGHEVSAIRSDILYSAAKGVVT
ncbi:uncharacterized protein TNCV_2162011 [Trichonephila clavipes]|nr:uncharacterized protein TNCV_2162011 [Trichonephila clavipes]